MKRKDRRAMSRYKQTPSPQPHSDPDQNSGQEQKRKVTGELHVRGEIEANLPPSLMQQYRAMKHESTPRDNARFSIEIVTLFSVLVVAALGGYQSYLSRQGVEISRDSLESVQRAFLFPTGRIESVLLPDGRTQSGIKFSVRWENNGNTPAKDLDIHSNMQWMPQFPENFKFEDILDPGLSPSLRTAYLAPHMTYDNNPRIVSIERLNNIAFGKIKYKMFGWARYRDVFKGTKGDITRYCYDIIVAPESRSNDVVAVQPRLINCDRNNCADDQCEVQ